MGEFKKENDWFATNLFNPTLGENDFRDQGLNEKNTGLQPKDYYKNKPEVEEIFKNDKGEFDENKFDNFYNTALVSYNTFVKEDTKSDYIKQLETTEDNFYRRATDKIIQPTFSIEKVGNIQLESTGITSMFGTGDPLRSEREAAQTQNVFDSKTQKELD